MRIAIIPARGGSTRIKDKNVLPFCGKPLIAYGLEAAVESGLYDVIHVSTDDPAIAETAAALGHPVEFLRDESLAHNHVPLFAVIQWVIDHYAGEGRTFDEICMIYAAQPLIEAADLARGHAVFAEHGGRHPVVTVGRLPSPIERAMLIGADGTLEWINPARRLTQSQDLPVAYFDTGAFMVMSAAHLQSSGFSAFETMLPLILPLHKIADINEPEDLELAEVLYRGRRAQDDAE